MFYQNKKLFLLLGMAVVVLLLYSLVSSFFSVPKIVSVFPKDGSTNVSVKENVIIAFASFPNKNLLGGSISPAVPYKMSVSGKILTVSFGKPLSYGETYLFSLKNRVGNKEVLSLRFKTEIPEGGPSIPLEAKRIIKDYYPLYEFTPPDNANFYYKYDDHLKITVFLKGNKASSQKEFEVWAKEKGVDLFTHQITYQSPP